MKTKLKFIIPALIMLFLTAFAERCISYRKPSDIDRIEIEIKDGDYYFNSYFGYIIDFNENTLTVTDEGQISRVVHFSDEDKENFIHYTNKYGFFSWEESYVNLNVDDGGYAYFLTIYNDGSQHETSCDNAYPPTYREMWYYCTEIFNNCMRKDKEKQNLNL